MTKPVVDWFSLAPALALLGASGVALLGAVLVPRRAVRVFSAIVLSRSAQPWQVSSPSDPAAGACCQSGLPRRMPSATTFSAISS